MNMALVVASGVLAGLADFLLKRWAIAAGAWGLTGGILGYALSAVLFAFSLRSGQLLTNGVTYAVVSGLMLVVVSQFVFHESISHRQCVGIGVAVVAIVLLA